MWCACALLLASAAAAPAGALAGAAAEVAISLPADGAVLHGPAQVTVQGRTGAGSRAPAPRHDVLLVLDVSGSTADASGADINRNGIVGQTTRARGLFAPRRADHSDPGDSVLAAEVAAAERLLLRLDADTTRVGIVTFSGLPGGASAALQQPLTRDFDAVRSALGRILEAGAGGGTDMAAGIRLAVRELAGLSGHASQPDPASHKVAVLLTDGFPTLPFGRGHDRDPRDVEVAVAASRVAASAGIAIHVFGLGEAALDSPEAAMEIPRVTGGRYTPVPTPGHVVEVVERASLTEVDILLLRNLTTEQAAQDVTVAPDGRFTGRLPLVPGPNRIGVQVLAADGTRAAAAVIVHYRPDASLELDLQRKHDELQRRLEQARERTRALERDVAETEQAARRRLDLEIQRGGPAPDAR
jgi:Mg-chelatase subunit ChlD